MNLEQLASMRQLLGFDETATGSLREFHARVQADLGQVVDGIFATVLEDQRARHILSRNEGARERLRTALGTWLDSMLLGPCDGEAYLTTRMRIGDRHVQVELPQDLILGAMAQVRQRLIGLALGLDDFPGPRETLVAAICLVVDLELMLLLESHRQSLLERLMVTERLSTIGQLVASIGHELRNPLSTIETSAYLLTQKMLRDKEDPSLQRHLDKIRHQVRVATKTITDLLELAKNRPPRRQPFELGAVVAASIEGIRIAEGVTLQIDIPEKLVVHADADQLRIVMVNLLSNALDAVGSRGLVRLVASHSMGGVSVRVTDDGPGIAPQVRDKVFQALVTTKPNGNGLGLPLCRRIAEAHGGCLALEPGEQGATFHLWLPGPEAAARAR